MDEQRKYDVRVNAAVERTQFHAVGGVITGQRHGNERTAVLVRPCDVLGRFKFAQTLERVGERIAEDGHLGSTLQNARHQALTLGRFFKRGLEQILAVFVYGNRQMQSAARRMRERLGQEGRKQAA